MAAAGRGANSLYRFGKKALGGLPYGPGLLYDDEDCSRPSSEEDDDVDHGDRVLVRNRGEDRESGRQDALESPESHFCQYLGLEVFPEAAYLCTGFHAGQGQVSFGSDYRRRADCLVAVDLSDDDDDGAESGGDYDDDDDDDDGGNDDDGSAAPKRRREGGGAPATAAAAGRSRPRSGCRRRRRHLLYYNLHGLWFHRAGRHLEDCELRRPRRDASPDAADRGSSEDGGGSGGEEDRELRRRVAAALRTPARDSQPPPPPRQCREPSDWQKRKEADDLAEESLKAADAEALSAVDPDNLRLEYRVVHECAFSHGRTAPDPATFRPRRLRRRRRCRRRRRSAGGKGGGGGKGDGNDKGGVGGATTAAPAAAAAAAAAGVAVLLRPDLRRLERERQRLEERGALRLLWRRLEREAVAAAAAAPDGVATAGRPGSSDGVGGRPAPAAAADRSWADYPTARALLAGKHPLDSLLGYAPRRMTQKTLVRRILETGFNSTPGVTMGGFVVVQGGTETRTGDGVLPGAFAFCHQRTGTRAEGLGRFTAMQARMHWGAAGTAATAAAGGSAAAAAADARADAKLESAAAQQGTLSVPGYHRRGTAISLDFFRFLVAERGFAGYRLRHFV